MHTNLFHFVPRPTPFADSLEEVAFYEPPEVNLGRIPVGSSQVDYLTHCHSSVLAGKFKNLKRKGRQLGKHEVFPLDLFLETPHLLLECPQEEHQPRLPVRTISTDGLLRLAQGEIVPLFAVLNHTFKGTVGRVGIAAAKQKKRGQDAR